MNTDGVINGVIEGGTTDMSLLQMALWMIQLIVTLLPMVGAWREGFDKLQREGRGTH